MRVWKLVAGCLACAGCGAEADTSAARKGGAELVVTLPPTLPTEPAVAEPAPQAGFETVAAVAPAARERPEPAPAVRAESRAIEQRPAQVEVTVAPTPEPVALAEAGAPAEATPPESSSGTPPTAARPAGATAWAGYLRRAGFPCRRIASAQPVARAAGPGLAYYRVECDGGASYQVTNKNGHLYFRRWRG
jgi:hypothetical protein